MQRRSLGNTVFQKHAQLDGDTDIPQFSAIGLDAAFLTLSAALHAERLSQSLGRNARYCFLVSEIPFGQHLGGPPGKWNGVLEGLLPLLPPVGHQIVQSLEGGQGSGSILIKLEARQFEIELEFLL